MTLDEVMHQTGRWAGTMKFFPNEPDARIGIAEEVASMCGSLDRIEWLVRRLPKLYADWPGTREVRAVLCSKFPPVDGFEVPSGAYIEGIPSERIDSGAQALPVPRSKQLPAGEFGEDLNGLNEAKRL